MVSLPTAIVAIALSSVGQTVLLDFYGDHCGPCRAMQPAVQALVNAGYPLQRVNVEQKQNAGLVAKYGVGPIPCFIMLVEGREVDRVVGGTTFSRLERMCKLGAAAGPPRASPTMLAQNAPPATPAVPSPSALAAPFEGWANQPVANQPVSREQTIAAANVSDAALLAASVRVRVEDTDGHSCGSGTIIDARRGEALILTCGHIFRDSRGKGRIEVDLFGPSGPQRVVGRLVRYEVPDLNSGEGSSKPDLGLVSIPATNVLATARVAPPGYRVQPGMPVISVGCNNGDQPTARRSQITSLDKFLGPPNVQVAGQPVEGRSGGGLFSSEGYVIGVCNAADPSDKEGLFAALGSIYAELDRKDATGTDLSFVYKSPSGNPAAGLEAARPAALAANPAPAASAQPVGQVDLASFNTAAGRTAEAPAALAPHEQAALDEIRRRKKDGSEVVIIVRSRDNPDAKCEVFMLDRASREFVSQLSADVRRPEKEKFIPTSLELPKPRKILLEWSADDEKAEGAKRPAAMMDAPPRIAPKDTVLR
jgi:thiol-disulfide isomerase/thioredoxin